MPDSYTIHDSKRGTTHVRLIRGGEEYFETLISLIHSAKNSIHLQCYIYEDDETGRMVGDALRSAAARGVSVYMLADGYASQKLSKTFISDLQASGIQFRFFQPLFKSESFYFGRRLHHKVFVADAYYALTGGVNIANHYNDLPGNRAWLDFAVLAEGNIAKELCILCWKTWYNFSNVKTDVPCEPLQILQAAQNNHQGLVYMRRNDWVRRKNEISISYLEMLRNARERISICCSYFLPGKISRRVLSQVCKRGVKVRVIIAGPSDVTVAKNAEKWMYDWLLRNHVEVFEYQPSVLHAKVATCDGIWATVGSYNMNRISAYASIELNLEIRQEAFALELENKLSSIIDKDCIRITRETHLKHKNWRLQLIRWCSYQFIRFTFFITTFYYKQR